MILFSFANPAFIYLWSQMFEKEGPAGTSIRLIFIFAGAVFSVTAIILQFFSSTEIAGKIISYIFMILPIFSLTYGLLEVAYLDFFANLLDRPPLDPLSFSAAGVTIPYFIATMIFYLLFTILIDKGIICSSGRKLQQERANTEHGFEKRDEDVDGEEKRVKENQKGGENENIQVVNLRKTYITENKMEDPN